MDQRREATSFWRVKLGCGVCDQLFIVHYQLSTEVPCWNNYSDSQKVDCRWKVLHTHICPVSFALSFLLLSSVDTEAGRKVWPAVHCWLWPALSCLCSFISVVIRGFMAGVCPFLRAAVFRGGVIWCLCWLGFFQWASVPLRTINTQPFSRRERIHCICL